LRPSAALNGVTVALTPSLHCGLSPRELLCQRPATIASGPAWNQSEKIEAIILGWRS
jgi:hypothetical protein